MPKNKAHFEIGPDDDGNPGYLFRAENGTGLCMNDKPYASKSNAYDSVVTLIATIVDMVIPGTFTHDDAQQFLADNHGVVEFKKKDAS